MTPYAKEITDALDTTKPVEYVTIYKGASIGMSSGVILDYITRYDPPASTEPVTLGYTIHTERALIDNTHTEQLLRDIITPKRRRRR